MSILMFHGVKDGGTDVHPFSRGRVVWRDGVNEMLQGTGSSLNVIKLCWPKFAGEDVVHLYGGPEP